MRTRVWCMSLVLAALGVACGDQPTEVVPDRGVEAGGGLTRAPGSMADATSSSDDGRVISTDKDDYAPGDTVWFTGTGWTPNDTLDIELVDDPLTHPPHTWWVAVGEDGTFRDSTYVVDSDDFGVTFTLTATSRSDSSRTLTVIFTDGNLSLPTPSNPSGFQSVAFSPPVSSTLGFTAAVSTTPANNPAPNGTHNSVNVRIRSAGNLNPTPPTIQRTLPIGDIANGQSASVSWNGQNGSNVDVPDGLYGARVFSNQAAEPNGANVQILVDRAAPVISSTSPTAPAVSPSSVTAGVDQDVTLTARATDQNVSGVNANQYRVVSAQYRIEGTPVGATAMNSADNAFDEPQEDLTVDVDGSVIAGLSAGNYLFCVRATDRAGNAGAFTITGNANCATLEVKSAVNQAPTVNAGGTYGGAEGSAIALSAATATDPTDDALLYSWSSSSTNCSFGAANVLNPSITCTDNGSYTATLSVDDQHGNVVTSNATVNVSNVKPTATLNKPTAAVGEGSSFELSLTGATDVSSVDVAAGLKFWFDCGEGSDPSDYDAASDQASTSCETATDGPTTLSVKGRVIDKDDGYTEYTGTVSVTNLDPSATFEAPSYVDEGSAFTLKLKNAADPSPVDATSLKFAFDCGTGLSATDYDGASTAYSKSCSTADDGPKSLSVQGKVFDKDGGISSGYSSSVSVRNVAPTISTVAASPSGQLVLDANNQASTTVTVTFSDPAVALDEPYETVISCGNNTTVTSSSTTHGSSTGVCTYSAADVGFRTISATVTDNDDGESTPVTTQVQIIYNWNGFFRPVDNPDMLNTAKAGSAIPVKFDLGGNQGLNIFKTGYPRSVTITCNSYSDQDAIEETVTAGGSTLTYDATAHQYVYVWKSDKGWAGTCRRLEVKLADETMHTALFKWAK